MPDQRVPLRDLYRSERHPCMYFPERTAQSLVAVPVAGAHDPLAEAGFRRSGEIAYLPTCPSCQACVPTRVVVADFRPRRRFRRVAARNADLDVAVAPAVCDAEQFALFERYLMARHPDGGMVPTSPAEFGRFVGSTWAETEFVTMRLNGTLVATAFTDVLPSGLSALYTYFDPDLAERSLGVCAILQQIELCRRRALPYLYLGFWVAGHPKMDYKRDYRPAQALGSDGWAPLADNPSSMET